MPDDTLTEYQKGVRDGLLKAMEWHMVEKAAVTGRRDRSKKNGANWFYYDTIRINHEKAQAQIGIILAQEMKD